MPQVMVVDDSLVARSQVVQALSEAGCEVVDERKAGCPQPLVVMCDVSVPSVAAVMLVVALKAPDSAGSVPIFMLTTTGAQELVIRPIFLQMIVSAVMKGAARASSNGQEGLS